MLCYFLTKRLVHVCASLVAWAHLRLCLYCVFA